MRLRPSLVSEGENGMKLKNLLAIEEKYGLLEDAIDGFAYWIFFRVPLWTELLAATDYGVAHATPPFSRKRQLICRLRMIRNALFHGKGFFGHSCDILILNDECRKWTGSCYESVFTDWIAAEYPGSVVLERPYLQQHFRPVRTKRMIYTDYIEIKATVWYVWNQRFAPAKVREIRKRIDDRVREPIREFCEMEGIDYDISRIVDMMVCGYYIYQVKRKEYRKLIDRYRPKMILEVCGYNADCMTVNELTRERGIPSVELQHGFTGAEHAAYNYLPGMEIRQFPQYFFSFSDYWIRSAAYPLPKRNLIAVGFPYLEREAAGAKAKVVKGKTKKIIFISQGPIGHLLSEIAVELDRLIDKDKYEIVYKLHPGEFVGWKDRYVNLAKSDIMVADSDRYNLYELFAASSFQIAGYGSTATYEGLYFDLKTYVLREKAEPELIELCENGYAVFFDTAQELYRLITEDSEMNNTASYKDFWKKDAQNNTKRELEKIMGSMDIPI